MAENSSECTHDCSTCSSDCPSRDKNSDMKLSLSEGSSVKHVIGVMSGKGGVGKSIVTSMMAVEMRRREKRTAVLDADITGPSIPKSFGVSGRIEAFDDRMLPRQTKTGIDIMSVNLLLDSESSPVVWRGPVLSGVVNQFWTDVLWNDIDYMFIDMPPGTGDVPLTVFQSLPLDGVIVVATPQDLVSMIVEKSINMVSLMNIPIIGVVENMAYAICPDCGKKIDIFGKSGIESVCSKFSVPLIGRLPIDPSLAKLCDSGIIELYENNYLSHAADVVEKFCAKNA